MSEMNNPGWDRPADSRHGPAPLHPSALSSPGLNSAEASRAGLSVLLARKDFGCWGKIVSFAGGLYDWYEVQDDGSGLAWVKNYNGFDFTGNRNAKEANGSTSVAAGTVAWFRRTTGLGGQAFAFVVSSSAGKLLVQITSRSYPAGGSPFALYSCNAVTDSTSPSALTYTAGLSGPDFYSLNDVDLPVGLVCWIYQSANGSWYLNDNDTRVDVVQKTGTTPDANGLYDGVLRRWNDGTKQLEDRGPIKVADITGP